MSKLRPTFIGPCVFCLVLGALYFLSSSGNSAMADKSSRGGLPARVETIEDALPVVFEDLDRQAALLNAYNFSVNARLDDLEARVIALEGGSIP